MQLTLYIVAAPSYLSSHGYPQQASDLGQHRIIGFTSPKVHAVYYRSSSVARRISAFIDFIQPRLKL